MTHDPDKTPMVQRLAKQVIVMRTDLGMRKGKMVAQGAHASLKVMLKYGYGGEDNPDPVQEWLDRGFTKVCVGVDSFDALDRVARAADDLGLPFARIVDSGHTEFHGVPTPTCVAVGPWWADEVDKVTGELRLL